MKLIHTHHHDKKISHLIALTCLLFTSTAQAQNTNTLMKRKKYYTKPKGF
jgi:hypothetical protein